MKKSTRCLYSSNLTQFRAEEDISVFGKLCENYHGETLTTTKDAWKAEISIMKRVLFPYANEDGQIIFEYDIPRLGKRIDVVLLLRGIVFCLEFKVGESRILEASTSLAKTLLLPPFSLRRTTVYRPIRFRCPFMMIGL